MMQWCSVVSRHLGLVVALLLALAGCTPGGDNGQPAAPAAPSARTAQQSIANLLALYQEAVEAEDSDRLAALLVPATSRTQVQAATGRLTLRQGATETVADLAAFQAAMQRTFRQRTVTGLTMPPETVALAPDHSQATFLEIESTLDPTTLAQDTRLYHTAWQVQQTTTSGITTVNIVAVQRDGPLIVVTTPGQMQAGALTRLQITTPAGGWDLAQVEFSTSSNVFEPLHANPQGFDGVFRAALAPPATLQVRLHRRTGEVFLLAHPYRLRLPDDGVVQRVPGTATTRLRAVVISPDGTVWAGGDQGARLFQLPSGAATTTLVGPLLTDPAGQIEDLVLDGLGRLHAVVVGPQGSGVLVQTAQTFCQTVNVLDPAYPLRTRTGQPSPGTRAVAAGGADLWLYGSDGGFTRVRDSLGTGACPPAGGPVTYDPVLRRETGQLPVNTVPALLVARDGALWIGSALGLSRVQDVQVTRLPFTPGVSFQGDPATLEAFF